MIHRSDSELNLDLIVFEQRNKSYGAFELRRAYNSNVKNALFAMVGIIGSLYILYSFFPYQTNKMAADVLVIACPFDKVIDINSIVFETKRIVNKMGKAVPPIKQALAKPSSSSFEIAKDPQTPTSEASGTFVAHNTDSNQGLSSDSSGIEGDANAKNGGSTDGEIKSDTDDRTSMTYADVMPTFPGGDKALSAYVVKNLKFPFVDAQVSGKVFVQFTIAFDGTVTNVQLMKGIHPQFDDEAMRVISRMPQWIPGKYHGRNVAVRKVIPIHFRVD